MNTILATVMIKTGHITIQTLTDIKNATREIIITLGQNNETMVMTKITITRNVAITVEQIVGLTGAPKIVKSEFEND